ncbi:M61 family metallopeptidase [Flavitalea sp.]|nr:PDZ domain-containing protein [Flavitalea sp.]
MKKVSLLVLFVAAGFYVFAQKISYIVSFPNINHHEANISLTVSGLVQKNAIFRMSRSSPGRYATHEFGKNVYDVKAFDKTGKQITLNKIDGDVYEVPRHDGFVRVEYTLFANHPDGTYAGIDPASIHLNSPATFLWVKGADKSPIDIKFNLPPGKSWTIATQLKPGTDSTLFSARDYQYLMDSPVSIGELHWKEWTQINPDKKSYKFRLALEANTNDSSVEKFVRNLSKITKQAQAVYGELPPFDYGTYTFLSGVNLYVKGDGMEHRNSTVINIPAQFTGNSVPSVFAHEFFHAWNVERIRPKTLEPFNFEKSNMSNELWFAEGFTQYYGELLLQRCGFRGIEEYTGTLTSLVNTKENTSGAKRFSPVEMSRHAVFVDAGVSIDKNNYANMYTSYYPYGASIALALDLELYSRYKLSLDNYMQGVWKRFGLKEQPYTVSGLESVLAEVTKDKAFAADFFSKYVNGHESFNYAPLFEKAGLKLSQPGKGIAWLGNLALKQDLSLNGPTIAGTPLYEAGLDADDKIIQLDGKKIESQSDLKTIIEAHKPGDKVSIQYLHREKLTTTEIVFCQNPSYTVRTFEKENMEITPDIIEFRKRLLGEKP